MVNFECNSLTDVYTIMKCSEHSSIGSWELYKDKTPIDAYVVFILWVEKLC